MTMASNMASNIFTCRSIYFLRDTFTLLVSVKRTSFISITKEKQYIFHVKVYLSRNIEWFSHEHIYLKFLYLEEKLGRFYSHT